MKRILSLLLTLTVILSILAPQAQATLDTDTLRKMTPNDARTWVLTELERSYNTCVNAVYNGDVYNAIVGYAEYLIHAYWAQKWQAYTAEELAALESHGASGYHQLFGADLIGETQRQVFEAYLAKAEYLRDLIQKSGVLSTGSLPTNCAAAVNHILPANPDFTNLFNALEGVVHNYVNLGIRTYLGAVGGTLTEEMVASVVKNKREIIVPIVKAYLEIKTSWGIAQGRAIQGADTLNGIEVELTYRAPETEGDPMALADDAPRWILDYLLGDGSDELNHKELALNAADDYGVLSILSNAINYQGTVLETDSGNTDLTVAGYYAIAAGAVYEPFISVAGGEEYMTILEELLPSGDDYEEILAAIQLAVATKKPLLYGSVSSWGDSGEEASKLTEYVYATVAHLVPESQKKNTIGVFVVPKGQAKVMTDGSTTEYIRASTKAVYADVRAADFVKDSKWTEEVETLSIQISEDGTALTTKQVSDPVFVLGLEMDNASISDDLSKRAALGAIVASNIVTGNKADDNLDGRLLFMNGLGDIVLSDGTIVIPAIANPMVYETPIGTDGEGNAVAVYDYELAAGSNAGGTTVHQVRNKSGYYPYTAAFSNHYPSFVVQDGELIVPAASWAGAYFLSSNMDSRLIKPAKIDKVTGNLSSLFSIWGAQTFPVASDTWSITSDEDQTVCGYPIATHSYTSGWQILSSLGEIWQSAMMGNGAPAGGLQTQANAYFMNRASLEYVSTGEGIFPLKYQADLKESYINNAGAVTTSALRYISDFSLDGSSLECSGKIDVQKLVVEWMGEALLGTQYAQTVEKSVTISYEDMVNDQYGRFTRLIIQFAENVIESLGHVDGVLAMKNGYENGFFNAIMSFVQTYYVPIAIILLILVAVRFLRGNYSAFYVVVIGVATFAAFEVYAVWMPTAVPAVYNYFVNDIVEPISWNTVALAADDYENTYRDYDRVDASTGAMRPYTSTVTLYRLTDAELDNAAESVGVDAKKIKAGEVVFLDRTAGIFLQGDTIKISVDTLLANNAMRGLYKSQWEEVAEGAATPTPLPIEESIVQNPYIIKLTSPYTSLEAYYTPFSQIERAFLVNLNRFTNIFAVQRNSIYYGDGFYKDAFVFNAFTNSGIFTAPGDKEILKKNINRIAADSQLRTEAEFLALVDQYFKPQDDWLNLHYIFYNPGAAIQNSLWGRVMQKQGYYGYTADATGNWTISEENIEKLEDLIYYINTQTKLWVIQNQDQLCYISDENAIKLTALYATTCFTHRLSNVGYWMYPNYLNAADIELCDVLYGAMVSATDRSLNDNGTVVDVVALHLGGVGAVLITAIVLLSVVFILVMTYLIPILYGLFGVVLVYKLINDSSSNGLVQGYVKVTAATAVLYLLYSIGLRCVCWAGYAWYGYVLCIACTLLCLYFLFFVVMSVIMNPTEMANDNLGRNLLKAANGLLGKRLSSLIANQLTVTSRNVANVGRHMLGNYNRSSSIDNRHGWANGPQRSESFETGYSRWEDFDRMDLSGRARVMERFAHVQEHASAIGTKKTGLRTFKAVDDMARSVGASAKMVKKAVKAADDVSDVAKTAMAAAGGPAVLAGKVAVEAGKYAVKSAVDNTIGAAKRTAAAVDRTARAAKRFGDEFK